MLRWVLPVLAHAFGRTRLPKPAACVVANDVDKCSQYMLSCALLSTPAGCVDSGGKRCGRREAVPGGGGTAPPAGGPDACATFPAAAPDAVRRQNVSATMQLASVPNLPNADALSLPCNLRSSCASCCRNQGMCCRFCYFASRNMMPRHAISWATFVCGSVVCSQKGRHGTVHAAGRVECLLCHVSVTALELHCQGT